MESIGALSQLTDQAPECTSGIFKCTIHVSFPKKPTIGSSDQAASQAEQTTAMPDEGADSVERDCPAFTESPTKIIEHGSTATNNEETLAPFKPADATSLLPIAEEAVNDNRGSQLQGTNPITQPEIIDLTLDDSSDTTPISKQKAVSRKRKSFLSKMTSRPTKRRPETSTNDNITILAPCRLRIIFGARDQAEYTRNRREGRWLRVGERSGYFPPRGWEVTLTQVQVRPNFDDIPLWLRYSDLLNAWIGTKLDGEELEVEVCDIKEIIDHCSSVTWFKPHEQNGLTRIPLAVAFGDECQLRASLRRLRGE